MATAFLTTPPPTLGRHTAPDSNRVTKRSPILGDCKNNRNTKAWTLDDERVLLQGRVERLPYKQIAAKLGKTDLACRLHFHQMVMAKRSPQTSPGRSIVFLSSEHPPEVHRLLPAPTITGETVPDLYSLLSRDSTSTGAESHTTMRQLHVPAGHQRAASHPPELPSAQRAFHARAQASSVDLGRLNDIYQEHARDFWGTIAAKYAGTTSLSAGDLEEAFLSARSAEESTLPHINIIETSPTTSEPGPLSRESSPGILRRIRSNSELSIAGKCSVESLLNHEST